MYQLLKRYLATETSYLSKKSEIEFLGQEKRGIFRAKVVNVTLIQTANYTVVKKFKTNRIQ